MLTACSKTEMSPSSTTQCCANLWGFLSKRKTAKSAKKARGSRNIKIRTKHKEIEPADKDYGPD